MQKIEIDPVSLQPPQALLTGLDRAFARRVMRQNLAHEIDLVTRTRDGFRDHFFSTAVAIHLGAIDDSQPQIDSSFQCRDFSRAIGLFLAHVPGAKPQGREGATARQLHAVWLCHTYLRFRWIMLNHNEPPVSALPILHTDHEPAIPALLPFIKGGWEGFRDGSSQLSP